MDDLMMMLLEAQERRKVTAAKWIYSLFMGLIAATLVLLFSISKGIALTAWFGGFGIAFFGIAFVVSVVMHFSKPRREW